MPLTIREINERLSKEYINVRLVRQKKHLVWVNANNGEHVGYCRYCRIMDRNLNKFISEAARMEIMMDENDCEY